MRERLSQRVTGFVSVVRVEANEWFDVNLHQSSDVGELPRYLITDRDQL